MADDTAERSPIDDKKPWRGGIVLGAVTWLSLIITATLANWVWGDSLPFVADPTARDAQSIGAGISREHWFGATQLGQDVFSRTLEGAEISLVVAASVTLIGIFVGGAMGLLAGYLRGWVDVAVRLFVNVTLSVPALLLVIFLVAVRGRSLATVIVALSLLAVPSIARIVRASTIGVAELDYVKASEALGNTRLAILRTEIFPNVMTTLISFAFLTTGIVLVAEGSLSFLGLSVESPTITWGQIIADGRVQFADTPHMVFLPAAVLFLTVLSLNIVGDELLKKYDVGESAIS